MTTFHFNRIAWTLVGVLCATAAVAQQTQTPRKPLVTHASRSDVSPPMRYMNVPPVQPMGDGSGEYEIPNKFLKPSAPRGNLAMQRSVPRSHSTGTPAPAIIASFDGINSTNSGCGCLPPDTEGDVSENSYFQWVNSAWAQFNKSTGAIIPNGANNYTAGNSFWTGFGGLCETNNDGDPVVVWDQFAHRWVASQFVIPPGAGNAGSAQCFAISTSPDALGTYYRYEFDSTYFGDYPKIGVWVDRGGSQDAYLLTTHEFDEANNEAFVGAAYAALQRDAMLEGRPANQVAMLRYSGVDAYGVEPVHLVGTEAAATGSCPVFVHFDANTSDYLFWDMCLNWNVPSSTTLSASPQRLAPNAPFAFDYNQVSQSGTTALLDSFGTHIMYHATARAFPFGAPERLSLAVNHTVLANVSSTQGVVRWARFGLNPQSDRIFGDNYDNKLLPEAPLSSAAAMTKTITDEGVHNPDANTRWMPASSIDANDNLGIGYSLAGGTNPKLAINGRTASDPLGTLEDEQICTPATIGHQTSSSGRWGDYANMTVDPGDQCTFYFTSEYYATTSTSGWSTRVCSFKFPNCGTADFAIVNDSPNRVQVCEATATADPSFNLRVGVLNGFNGAITLSATAPAGVTPTFSNNPVSPTPGPSRLTLTGANTLAPGNYNVTVTGTSAAPATRSVAMSLGISDHVPTVPTLNTPANAATGVKIYPSFSWSAIADALSYRIDVATDAAFLNIVATGTSTTNSWSPNQPLAQSTQFYWRVTPNNYCGSGAVSQTFSFTTGVPGTCPAGTTLTPVASWNWNDTTAQGWTVTGSGGGAAANHLWTLTATPAVGTGFGTNSYAYFIKDNATSSNWDLVSPSVPVPGAAQSAFLKYDVYHGLEDDGLGGCWDALTIMTDTGSGFQYLPANRMLTDPYNGPSQYTGNPVWCTVSGAPAHSIVDFDTFIGQSVKFQFDVNTDGSNGPVPTPNGIAIDNVEVDVCQ